MIAKNKVQQKQRSTNHSPLFIISLISQSLEMAHSTFLVSVIITIISISSHQLNLDTHAAAAPSPDDQLSPYTELAPDVTPLLPSPGGTTSSANGSPVPTIPSSRSPPYADTTSSIGPDNILTPTGSLMDSSAVSQNLVKAFDFRVVSGCLASSVGVVLMI